MENSEHMGICSIQFANDLSTARILESFDICSGLSLVLFWWIFWTLFNSCWLVLIPFWLTVKVEHVSAMQLWDWVLLCSGQVKGNVWSVLRAHFSCVAWRCICYKCVFVLLLQLSENWYSSVLVLNYNDHCFVTANHSWAFYAPFCQLIEENFLGCS